MRSGQERSDGEADCGWAERRRAARRASEVVAQAFVQACTEYDIPPHPGGECPSPDCRCKDEAVGDAIEARAVEIAAAELGITPAELEAS